MDDWDCMYMGELVGPFFHTSSCPGESVLADVKEVLARLWYGRPKSCTGKLNPGWNSFGLILKLEPIPSRFPPLRAGLVPEKLLS